MKKHAMHITISGLVAPIALLLATAIANEGQTLLGLHLDNVALALYLTPFLVATAGALYGLGKAEAARLGTSLVGDLASIFGGLGAAEGTPAPAAATSPPSPPAPGTLPPPPPPAP